jgi:tetratricopeptide (TPR) repeat protein
MRQGLRCYTLCMINVLIIRGLPILLLLPVLGMLAACATAPPPAPTTETVPLSPEDVELTLNLPEERADCVCAPEPENDRGMLDRTFLDRGMETLAGGDYIEAVQHFQRYRRLEQAELAQWESELAIAYVSILPSSPFYDTDAALGAYTDLQAREPTGQKHPSIVLMQQALESFVIMERHVQELEGRAAILQEDLDKREQALKRLRELTLGQPADVR